MQEALAARYRSGADAGARALRARGTRGIRTSANRGGWELLIAARASRGDTGRCRCGVPGCVGHPGRDARWGAGRNRN